MKNEQAPPTRRENSRFSAKRIDQVQDLDLEHITREDLIWQHRTELSVPHGAGRMKAYTYRNGVQTRLGDLELSVWTAAAEYVIRRDGLEQELEHLRDFITHERRGPKCLSRDVVRRSLQNCISGLYQNPKWVDFIPYNQCYHPEVLEKAHLVRIASECCQVPGYVTEEQIMQSCDGKVACPICGRFSNYKPLT